MADACETGSFVCLFSFFVGQELDPGNALSAHWDSSLLKAARVGKQQWLCLQT